MLGVRIGNSLLDSDIEGCRCGIPLEELGFKIYVLQFLHDLLLLPESLLKFRFQDACHLLGGPRVLGNNHNEADPAAVEFLEERECLGLPINNEYQRSRDIEDTLHAPDEFYEYVSELGGRRYEFEQNEVPVDVVELSQMYFFSMFSVIWNRTRKSPNIYIL
jgi:hypothetical protein